MKSLICVTLILFSINIASTQSYGGEFINIKAGLGFNESEVLLNSKALYIKAEYVYNLKSWVGFRPYMSYLNTRIDDSRTDARDISSSALNIGAKMRILIPIFYEAPFIEIGYGLSFGSFNTITDSENIRLNGISTHVPISLGIAIGDDHEFEISFDFYTNTKAKQSPGAVAIGISIPINE